MPAILRKLPFFDRFTTVEIQGRGHRVFPLQVIVWLSLGPQGLRHPDPRTQRFPAVLDPAFTDGFLIHEQHLGEFAGFHREHFRRLPESMRTQNRAIPLHAANVWLHRNQPGQRDQFAGAPPFLLELHRGIGITTDVQIYPRLPLLGARALRGAGLQVHIDYQRCRVSVRTPRRFWILG